MTVAREDLILGLAATGLAGWREWQRFEAALGDPSAIAGPGAEAALLAAGLRPRQVAAFVEAAREGRGAEVRSACARSGILVTTVEEGAYPVRLRQLPNPPLVLFHRGRLPTADEFLVGIVGSRRASRYGRRVARALAEDLAADGFAVVSGLARGIDTEAHEGSLGGPGASFAVVGSGLDEPYPPENVGLSMRIEGRGGVIGEFAPGVPPRPGNFPRRNRLIAALAGVVVVVEAAARSGALITARWAAELGRDVAAIPGPIDSATSEGPLALLRDGARMIRGLEDMIEDGLVPAPARARTDRESRSGDEGEGEAGLDAEDRRLLALMDHEPVELDALLGALDLAPGTVLARLLSLELRGRVERDEALRFRLRTEGRSP